MNLYIKKTWVNKRDDCKKHQIKTLKKNISDMKAGSLMLIPSTRIIDNYIRGLSKGSYVDFKTMRKNLSKIFNCDVTCPLTSGIFLRIVSEAAYEEFKLGKNINKITPFWRCVNPDSKLAFKLSFGIDFLISQQFSENITF